MVKKMIVIALIMGILLLPGCSTKSNVQTWSDNQARGQLYHEINKSKSVKYASQALEHIIGYFEDIAYNDGVKKIVKSAPVVPVEAKKNDEVMFRYTSYNSAGKVNGLYEISDVTTGYVAVNNKIVDYMIQKDINDLHLELARTKERVVIAFQPIFEQICMRMEQNGNPPSSWIDVARDFVKHVPTLATMGAMYGIAEAGIAAAGNTINANLSDNAQFDNNNIVGNGNTTDGSSINESDIANDESQRDSGNTDTPKEE